MTTASEWRKMCAELLGIFEKYDDESNLGGIIWDMKMDGNDLLERAYALLAQPEPQGFTPDHVNLMCFAFEREPWATWLRRGGCLESAHCELSDLMLAVLARWGTPTNTANQEDY
jgi:hypothetical protein